MPKNRLVRILWHPTWIPKYTRLYKNINPGRIKISMTSANAAIMPKTSDKSFINIEPTKIRKMNVKQTP